MGLFRDLGKRVERFKHQVEEAAEESEAAGGTTGNEGTEESGADGATSECEACGERFSTDPGTCPECGSDAVVEAE